MTQLGCPELLPKIIEQLSAIGIVIPTGTGPEDFLGLLSTGLLTFAAASGSRREEPTFGGRQGVSMGHDWGESETQRGERLKKMAEALAATVSKPRKSTANQGVPLSLGSYDHETETERSARLRSEAETLAASVSTSNHRRR